MKINHPEWYPCYLNPSFDEILELAKSGWDTCRILHDKKSNDLVIASGYGNTHNSIQNAYFIHFGAFPIEVNGRIRWKTNSKRLPYMNSYILWHDFQYAMMNTEGEGNELWSLDVLGDTNAEIVKDLIRESGYTFRE